jgi:hypothetical protein
MFDSNMTALSVQDNYLCYDDIIGGKSVTTNPTEAVFPDQSRVCKAVRGDVRLGKLLCLRGSHP